MRGIIRMSTFYAIHTFNTIKRHHSYIHRIMAKSTSNRPATLADVQRAIAQASVPRSRKKSRSTRNNSDRSADAPIAVGATLTNRGPDARANSANTRIRNTEFVGDVLGSPSNYIYPYELNPNSAGLFTWLSRIASGYELFRFHKLEFNYTPICPSSTTGVVVMGFDYDASDPNPTTKQALTGFSGSKRTNVWQALKCEMSPPTGWFYVGAPGSAINPTGTDIKFYDVAKFYLGIFNFASTIVAGELTVTYDVEFAKPDFTAQVAYEYVSSIPGSTLANLAGSGAVYSGSNVATLASPQTNAFTLTFNIPGRYLIEVNANFMSTSGLLNGFGTVNQQDPGAGSTTVPWADYAATGWVSTSSVESSLNLLTVTAAIGTVVTITAAAGVTVMNLMKMRVAPYLLN